MRKAVKASLFAIGWLAALSFNTALADSKALSELVEKYFEEHLELNPLNATFIGDPRYNDRLPNDIAPDAIAERVALEQRYLNAATKIDITTLTPEDRITWEVFMQQRRMAVADAQFPQHLLPFNQMFSLPNLMPVLGSATSAQPFATPADYDNFAKRLRDYVKWSDQSIVNMREGVRTGVVHPRVVAEKTLAQFESIVVDDPKKSLFYEAVRKMPDSFSSEEKQRISREYEALVRDEVIPAYRRVRDYLRTEYLPHTRATVGWTQLPNGKAWYAHAAKRYTTTDLAPEVIHDLGLKEVARIRGEMEEVKRQVKFKGDLQAFFRHLQEDPKFYYSSEAELLQGYRDLKKTIDARLPKLFNDFPKAEYEVRAVEAFRAASSAGASYQSPSADGSRPGIFYVNTHNLKAQPKFGMETLSLHEAAPGHHFQIAIQQELTDLPRFRRFDGYVAYAEGWALYAESLGKELGLFTDPYQYYGRLNDEMLRAMRLVVDTGLHSKGWTREQGIEYMLANSSMAASDVEAEVERYIAIPGQALGYKIGQLKITELRARAQSQLGKRFDVKEFHSQVLRTGSVPLDVLEGKIDRWIESKKKI